MTMPQVLDKFLSGATEGFSGTKNNPGNIKINGDQFIHYWTPIMERFGDKYLVNVTRYSLQTGKVQKAIKEKVEPDKYIEVKRVPENYKGSLKDFYVEGENV